MYCQYNVWATDSCIPSNWPLEQASVAVHPVAGQCWREKSVLSLLLKASRSFVLVRFLSLCAKYHRTITETQRPKPSHNKNKYKFWCFILCTNCVLLSIICLRISEKWSTNRNVLDNDGATTESGTATHVSHQSRGTNLVDEIWWHKKIPGFEALIP
jgi:hypothetical protein